MRFQYTFEGILASKKWNYKLYILLKCCSNTVLRIARLLTHTAWIWWKLVWRGVQMYVMLSDPEERWSTAIVIFKALHPISLHPSARWPIPASVFVMCDLSPSKYLSILYTVGVGNLQPAWTFCMESIRIFVTKLDCEIA